MARPSVAYIKENVGKQKSQAQIEKEAAAHVYPKINGKAADQWVVKNAAPEKKPSPEPLRDVWKAKNPELARTDDAKLRTASTRKIQHHRQANVARAIARRVECKAGPFRAGDARDRARGGFAVGAAREVIRCCMTYSMMRISILTKKDVSSLANLRAGKRLELTRAATCSPLLGTQAGKGATLIVPNLRRWEHNVWGFDPKGENIALCWKQREAMGQRVAALDPYHVAKIPERLRATFNPLADLDADDPFTPSMIKIVGGRSHHPPQG